MISLLCTALRARLGRVRAFPGRGAILTAATLTIARVHGQVKRASEREGAAAIGVGGKPIECPVLIHVSDDETHKDDGMPLPDAPGAPKSHWFKKPRLPSKPTG